MSPKTKAPIALVFGTRPEIIKLSPLMRLFEKEDVPYFMVHTGQHYSYNMDAQFFEDLELPKPKWKFTRPASLGSNQHAELVQWMRESVEEVLRKEKPGVLLVQGDTDAVLAGAQAATTMGGIRIGHVEAGLRSYDNNMPEERNRIATDKLSHFLFAPTESARQNLIKEKLDDRHIEVTGNTIVDALFQNLAIAEKRADKSFKKGYALVTLHRPETVDNKERLLKAFQAMDVLVREKSLRMIFPAHPRTKQRFAEYGISLERKGFSFVDPMGFLDFIWLEKNAELILTDSGGVQEEACILKVPCVTIRTTTERPETVEAGGNVVAGYEPDRIVLAASEMMQKKRDWANPFGDGHAAEKIFEAIQRIS